MRMSILGINYYQRFMEKKKDIISQLNGRNIFGRLHKCNLK